MTHLYSKSSYCMRIIFALERKQGIRVSGEIVGRQNDVVNDA